MLNLTQDFVRTIHEGGQTPYWLSLLGNSGAGKTFLADMVIAWARKHQEHLMDPRNGPGERWSRVVKRYRWPQCCELMMQGNYGWITEAKTAYIAQFDDIGAEYEKMQALTVSKLYDIFNARRGLWTIITANLSVQQIGQKLDTRIASRLFRDGGEVIEVKVPDYCLQKFNERKMKQ